MKATTSKTKKTAKTSKRTRTSDAEFVRQLESAAATLPRVEPLLAECVSLGETHPNLFAEAALGGLATELLAAHYAVRGVDEGDDLSWLASLLYRLHCRASAAEEASEAARRGREPRSALERKQSA